MSVDEGALKVLKEKLEKKQERLRKDFNETSLELSIINEKLDVESKLDEYMEIPKEESEDETEELEEEEEEE